MVKMHTYEPLTELQWQLFEPLFPKIIKRTRGKPHTPWRQVLNSILFVLLTKAKWGSLPTTPDFASKSSAHRWFAVWEKTGLLQEIVDTYKRLNSMVSDVMLPKKRNRCKEVSAVLSV